MQPLFLVFNLLFFLPAVLAFSRDEVVSFLARATKTFNNHFVENPALTNSLVFTPNAVHQTYMFGQWSSGSYDQIILPFAAQGKSFTVVFTPNAVGDAVVTADWGATQTTLEGCNWSDSGSAIFELVRSPDGEIRASKFTFIVDNESAKSLMDCMNQKKDL